MVVNTLLWFAALTCSSHLSKPQPHALLYISSALDARMLLKKMQASRLGLFTGIFREHYIDFPRKFILSIFYLKHQLEKV